MPWYLSAFRVSFSAVYAFMAATQLSWIVQAEDRYRRSLTWRPAIATVTNHHLELTRLAASRVKYNFDVDGVAYTGSRFRSGGVWAEEHMRDPRLLGVGTQLVIHYNPADPRESAMMLRTDRGTEAMLCVGALLAALLSHRAVRCETILPNMYYRLLSVDRRAAERTGMRRSRAHALTPMTYGKQSGAV